jgi:hypothetical protein
VTVHLNPALAARALRDIAEGRADSLAGWLAEAADAKVRADTITRVLADLLEDTGGPLSEQEVNLARERLAPD